MKTKSTKFKIPYAIKSGNVIHVSQVSSGYHEDCRCIGCGEGLVARKGSKVSHHFSHKADTECSPESVLHKLGKFYLKKIITNAIKFDGSISMTWKCKTCNQVHEGGITKKAVRIEEEVTIGKSRADLALFDSSGKVYAVIEIIVTHPPEIETINNYRKRGIIRIDFTINDLDDLRGTSLWPKLTPSYVDLCIAKKCSRCGKVAGSRKMTISKHQCSKCRKMRLLIPVVDTSYETFYSYNFLNDEVLLAEKSGVTFKKEKIKDNKFQYIVKCPNCETTIKRLRKKENIVKEIEMGPYCEDCFDGHRFIHIF